MSKKLIKGMLWVLVAVPLAGHALGAIGAAGMGGIGHATQTVLSGGFLSHVANTFNIK